MRANLATTRRELDDLKQAVVSSNDEAWRKGGSLLRALRDFFTDLLKGDYSKLEVRGRQLAPACGRACPLHLHLHGTLHTDGCGGTCLAGQAANWSSASCLPPLRSFLSARRCPCRP